MRIDLIQESAAILLIKHPRETPRLILHGLDVLDFDFEHIASLGAFNVEWAGQIMDFGEVNILHVVGAVVVTNLATCPVDAFDFDGLVLREGGNAGDVGVPAVLLQKCELSATRRLRCDGGGGGRGCWMRAMVLVVMDLKMSRDLRGD